MITLSRPRTTWTVGALMLCAAAVAQAGSVGSYAACGNASFGTYAASGYRCTLGAVDVFNFELYTVDAAGTPTVAGSGLLNTIFVDPTWSASTGIAQVIVAGFTGMVVDRFTTEAWMIRFTIDPPPVVSGEDMSLDPPFGIIQGTQSYCADGLFNTSGVCSSGTGGLATFGIGTPAQLRFTSPLATLDTMTTIRLNPGLNTPSGFDGVVFDIYTTQGTIPEPGTWLMMATGLGLAGLGRSLRTRASER
ncbi:MAG: PEP-CTERM sorting domain-containing protein [Acidobacteriia bacterium]|jgi:hypothetical protein|nr:PEP-CTERM sorting domain-containing protein [Terriglobia bacterium]